VSILKTPPVLFDQIVGDTPFSIVIAHQPLTCFSLLLTKRLGNIPLLYVYHSPSHAEYEIANKDDHHLKNLPHIIFRKLIERICLNRSSKIMVLSSYMKAKIEKIHKIQPERIIINPGGSDFMHFKPLENRNKIKAELYLPANKIHLLTIRNLEPRMGLDNLLNAIKLLKESEIGIHLTIGGEGAEREKLDKMIAELGVGNEVTMTGFIPSSRLPSYYGAADFFILPTRFLEGFGLVTPESMACGTPVLGTPVGGIKEILGNFDTQLLFKDTTPKAIAHGIQKAIKIYYKEENIYNQLRTRCRQFAIQNYSWRRHINQLKSIIVELTESEQLLN
jgi:glycosyltransferase involved in cell wall biosynthesis